MFSRCLLALRLRLERELLSRLLRRESLVSETFDAATQEHLFATLRTLRPRVVLLDSDIVDPTHPDVDQVRQAPDAPPFVVLAASGTAEHTLPWLAAGVEGLLPKTAGLEDLRHALRRVGAGRRYVYPPIAETLVEHLTPEGIQLPSLDRLSRRERQVFERIARGAESPQIAQELGLSVKTVSTYRSRVLSKLGLRNNAQVVLFALRRAGTYRLDGGSLDTE